MFICNKRSLPFPGIVVNMVFREMQLLSFLILDQLNLLLVSPGGGRVLGSSFRMYHSSLQHCLNAQDISLNIAQNLKSVPQHCSVMFREGCSNAQSILTEHGILLRAVKIESQ